MSLSRDIATNEQKNDPTAGSYENKVEIIVVCNRCTDNTAKLAERCGARVIYNEDRCIAKVRNAGINAAKRNTAFCVKTSLSIPQGNLMIWATGSTSN